MSGEGQNGRAGNGAHEDDPLAGAPFRGANGSARAGVPPPPPEHTSRTTRTIDDARTVEAHAKAYEIGNAANRLSLESAMKALEESFGREMKLRESLNTAQDRCRELVDELHEERKKDKAIRKLEAKNEKLKIKTKARTEVYKKALETAGPLVPVFAPKLLQMSDRWFPTAISMAANGEKTPRSALMRLLAKLYDPDPEGPGVEVLGELKILAGADDWLLIERAFMELAAQPPPSSSSSSSAPSSSTSTSTEGSSSSSSSGA